MSRLLLVWDAPNLDMGLSAILGKRPEGNQRPRFDALGRWMLAHAGRLAHESGEHVTSEATVFTNITPGSAEAVRPWVEALRNQGYAVFAKPKLTADTDVDLDMTEHIRARFAEGDLAGVIVASADGQNFRDTLLDLAQRGVHVTVLGFHEHCPWAIAEEALEFVDLESVPGVFRSPLPRVNLDNLPDAGAWLQPLRPLTTLLRQRARQQRGSAVAAPSPEDTHPDA